MTGTAPIVYDFTGHPALNLHLLAVHCNGAALTLSPEEAADQHHHEHFAPGGLRHHGFESLHWDAVKATEVLNEAAQPGPGEDPDPDRVALLLTPYQPEDQPQPQPQPQPQFGWVRALPVGEHTHTDTLPSVPCPDGNTCAVFPRYVAAHSERFPVDQTPNPALLSIENPTDLAAYHLTVIRREAALLEALTTDPRHPDPRAAALAIAASEHALALTVVLATLPIQIEDRP